MNSRERLAWSVLLAAFGVFCLLAVSIPLSLRWYLINATRAQRARLEVIEGTILVETKTGLVPNKAQVEEGDTIWTDATSRGRITFFDDSSLTLFPETKVGLVQMRKPLFSISPRGNSFLVMVDAGRTRIRVAPADNPATAFAVDSPHAKARLGEGDFAFKVTFDSSDLAVRQGKADLYNPERSIRLDSGERAIARPDRSLFGPVAAARDLLENGDFRQPLGVDWVAYEDQGGDAGEISGSIDVRSLPDRQAIRFFRTGGEGNHCETGIRQRVDEDISDSHQLILRLDLQVLNQSLSGGGYQSSEYPVMVRIDYRDENKNPNFWIRGFYYWSDGTWPTLYGEKVPQSIWYPYENTQLLEEMNPRPFYIDSIRIYASGWDYESLVSSVELLTE